MPEINASPLNGYRAVSLFSGCGGSSLGYRMAGFKVIWASEFIPEAADCYRANFSETTLDGRDIRQVKPEEILEATGLKPGELDLLDGSPPCASFSTAGKREAGWGKVKAYSSTRQRTDDLFFEYARILDGVRPRMFVAENVSGLVKGTAKGYFKEILAALKATGYKVRAQVLDAQWLGVPQMRQRLIFMGVRDDLNGEPSFPKPLPYRYSVRDALPALAGRAIRDDRGAYGNGGDITSQPSPTGLSDSVGTHWVEARVINQPGGANGTKFTGGDVTDKPCPAILAGRASGRSRSDDFVVEETVLAPGIERMVEGLKETLETIDAATDISEYAIGREWDKLKPGEQSAKYFQLVKPDPALPCPTVTQRGGDNTVASVTHPTERRKFTIAELKRICAFPDDFQLLGTYAQQWERLGRAVPPLMMRAIAEAAREVLEGIDVR